MAFKKFYIYWSSHQRCSIKKLFLKILQYSQENTCVGVSLITFQDEIPANTFKRLQHRCVPVSIAKILRTPIFEESLKAAVLHIKISPDLVHSSEIQINLKPVV